MNQDILPTYQKYLALSANYENETLSEADLLKCSYYKRYSSYLAYLQTISSCSNQTSCLVLEQKLKEYSSLIDNRKGINNFASVAKSLANNFTNASKKWKSGLDTSLSDLSIKKLLKCNEGKCCENFSDEGCSAAIPSQHQVNYFFSSLSKLKQENHVKNNCPPQSVLNSNQDNGDKKKSSLYSTYEDSYLDQFRSKFKTRIPNVLIQQRLNSKSFGDNMNQTKICKSKDDTYSNDKLSTKRFNSSDNVTVKRYQMPADNYSKRNMAEDYESSGSRRYNTDRIKKMSKFLNEDEKDEKNQPDFFKTASETLKIQSQARYGGGGGNQYGGYPPTVGVKKSLGGKGRSSSNRFVPPLRISQEEESDMMITRSVFGRNRPGNSNGAHSTGNPEPEDERLSHIDPKMIELIRSEIMDHGAVITWDDIAGLEFAKHTIQEIVVWPMLRPDIFTGLRAPPKGILLFGPPGTGKTLIGKCIASQSKSTFFSISASSLTSKWIGDGEKMVRALFAVARVEQPSVVFIDEIDSLLSQRSDQEHESSRRIKTEFLVQLDGAATGEEDRLLIIGATNRPQELDEAARRRLVKRLYIPLPDLKARKQLVGNLMSKERNDLTEADLDEIAQLTDGYSGADMKNLCQEASLGPIRTISAALIAHINPDQVRAVNIDDFKVALKRVRSSVASKDLDLYLDWDKQFGMSS